LGSNDLQRQLVMNNRSMSSGAFAVRPRSAGLALRESAESSVLASRTPIQEKSTAIGVGQRRPSRRHRPDRTQPRWTNRYVAALLTVDTLVGALALLTVHVLLGLSGSLEAGWVIAAIFAWPISIAAAGGYNRGQIGLGAGEISAVLRAMLYVIGAGAFAFVVAGELVSLLAATTPIMVLLGMGTRFFFRKAVHLQQRNGQLLRSVVVVGSLASARHLTSVLEREPHCGLKVIGVCLPEDEMTAGRAAGLIVYGDLDHVAAVVAEVGCDSVAVTAGHQPAFLRRLSWSLEGLNVDLLVHPGLVEVAGPRMHLRPYVGLPLLHVEHSHFHGWRRVVKRATDVVLTSLGMVVFGPVMLVIAICVKLTDHGPVFFRQTRVGLDGRTFTMIKFRSMVVDAGARLAYLQATNEGAGLLFKMRHDPRITRVGQFLRRYSLDELPQLFNVLAGDMSLVGPRPPLPSEVDAYPTDVHRRLLVQPGLTGLWQVSGRSLLSWEESVRLDLRYVENWCLSMDLLLLWKTVWAVLARRGAY